MRTTCIVDNYNYEAFLVEAVESALRQTVPFDEIVIVDDGSTDGSRSIIEKHWASDPRVKVVFKENGGQLSAFNAGFEASSGDLVFFLDSDDIFHPDYLEKMISFYHAHPRCEFAFCGYQTFGRVNQRVVLHPGRADLGITAIRVNESMAWLGGPTSTISMKKGLAHKILPYPHPDEWLSRADDVLVFGASLVGGHKFFNSDVLVRYRIHSENAWYGKTFHPSIRLKRELAIKRLFAHFRSAMGYETSLGNLAYLEFSTIPAPDYKLFKVYRRIVANGVPSLSTRVKYYSKLAVHLFSKKGRKID